MLRWKLCSNSRESTRITRMKTESYSIRVNWVHSRLTRLPHPARLLVHQRLAFLAAEGFGEFGHVGHHVVHAIPRQRVGIADHLGAHDFRALLGAPGVGVGEEETLLLAQPVGSLIVQTLALFLQSVGQRN